MYLPVPGPAGPQHNNRDPSTRNRAASPRSRRAGTADSHAARPIASRASNPYGARRSHRKVRTGCTKCKERKIKCDEGKPSCWQCTRHNVQCDFANSRPSSVSGTSPPANDQNVNVGLSPGPMVSPSGLYSDGTPVVSPNISMEDAAAEIVVANSTGDAHDDSFGSTSHLEVPSAAAAFAFLEWSLNANRAAGASTAAAAAGTPSVPTLMPYDPARDATLFAAPAFTPRSAPVRCASADDHAALNMTDLFLLHHFTTVTAPSLNPWHAGMQQWWQHEVPRVALRHPFVMRSLLALAGLHVAYLSGGAGDTGDDPTLSGDAGDTKSFHIARAIEQHKLAGQTASSILLKLDRATSAPMYLFSVITQIISMAMPQPPQDPNSIPSWDSVGAQEWIRLMRGVKTIADLGEAWGVEGGMLLGARSESTTQRALWKDHRPTRSRGGAGADTESVASSNSSNNGGIAPKRRSRWHVMHEPPLAALRDLIEGNDGGGGGEMECEDMDDMDERQACLDALDQLVFVFSSFLEQGECIQTVRLIFSWLCRLDTQFLDNLSRHDPHCLLVFAYHAVLLHWTDRAWWLEGWGPRIVDSISSILGGAESKYKEWFGWPRMQMGLPALG